MIPLVVASERGLAQTVCVAMHMRGSRTTPWHGKCEERQLEGCAVEGDSPVSEACAGLVAS